MYYFVQNTLVEGVIYDHGMKYFPEAIISLYVTLEVYGMGRDL